MPISTLEFSNKNKIDLLPFSKPTLQNTLTLQQNYCSPDFTSTDQSILEIAGGAYCNSKCQRPAMVNTINKKAKGTGLIHGQYNQPQSFTTHNFVAS